VLTEQQQYKMVFGLVGTHSGIMPLLSLALFSIPVVLCGEAICELISVKKD